MANEFVVRRGIIAQSGGARITGSLLVSGAIDATGYEITANTFTGSFVGDGSGLLGVVAAGTISSSIQVDITGTTNFSTFSSSLATVDQNQQSEINGLKAATGSYAINATIQGQLAGVASSSSQVKEYLPTGTVSSSAQFPGWVTASSQIDITATTGYSTFSSSIATKNDVQDVSITALNAATSSYAIDATIQGQLAGVVSSSTQVQPLLPAGTVSSSNQVVVQNTTGIGALATTGSNTFDGIQTISNTTNSTNSTNGSVIVQGGMGIAKDVNISGSLTVTGLLTAVSMSTQYVTSSQYVVGTSRVIVNDDDLVRFAGLTVIDSGSTAASGSVLWDSLKNHFIYETNDEAVHSALFIAGPETYGTLGDETELVVGRVPVATTIHNIDNRPQSSSIRIDYPSLLTHIESGLIVTGSVTSSVGFSGDGSQLTGIVTTLNITGSDVSTDSIDLKTSGLTFAGANGITTTVASDTVTITAPLGTVSSSGQVKVLLPGGTVSASAQFPGWVTASSQIALAEITGTTFASSNFTFPQQLTVTGVLSGSTSAFINNTLYSGSVVTGIVGPVSNQVVASLVATDYDGVFFDYVVKDGTNYRTGTVMVVANGTNVEFTDTSTNDIGNTAGVSFTADIVGGLIRLKFTNTTGTWTFKTVIRAL